MWTYDALKEKFKKDAERISYIDFKLRFTGVVRRSDICELFNLSDAAASRLLSEYNEICPGNMSYNRTIRANSIESGYIPLIEFDSETALGMLANGFNKNKLESPSKTIIPFERIASIRNSLNSDSTAIITRAIESGRAIKCSYASQNSENHNQRVLVPLIVLHDGTSWIFRAFDRTEDRPDKSQFKNFNFSRVIKVGALEDDRLEKESIDADREWNHRVPVELKIHEDRTEKQKDAIRASFGIEEGEDRLLFTEREALLWILYKKWQIDTRSLEDVESHALLNKSGSCKEKKYKFKLVNKDMIDMLIVHNRISDISL